MEPWDQKWDQSGRFSCPGVFFFFFNCKLQPSNFTWYVPATTPTVHRQLSVPPKEFGLVGHQNFFYLSSLFLAYASFRLRPGKLCFPLCNLWFWAINPNRAEICCRQDISFLHLRQKKKKKKNGIKRRCRLALAGSWLVLTGQTERHDWYHCFVDLDKIRKLHAYIRKDSLRRCTGIYFVHMHLLRAVVRESQLAERRGNNFAANEARERHFVVVHFGDTSVHLHACFYLTIWGTDVLFMRTDLSLCILIWIWLNLIKPMRKRWRDLVSDNPVLPETRVLFGDLYAR